MRLAVDEFFADLADDDPLIALALQQRAQALFADAIGRGGVDQVDAKVLRQPDQLPRLRIVWNAKPIGILDALIAAQFDGAQPQWRNHQAGAAERTVQVV